MLEMSPCFKEWTLVHLAYVQKTLKFPPVVLILGWILLVYVQDLRLFRLTFPLFEFLHNLVNCKSGRRHFTRECLNMLCANTAW